jgi:hypothetical protein
MWVLNAKPARDVTTQQATHTKAGRTRLRPACTTGRAHGQAHAASLMIHTPWQVQACTWQVQACSSSRQAVRTPTQHERCSRRRQQPSMPFPGLRPHRAPLCQTPHHAHYRDAWKSPRHLSATPHTTQHTCSTCSRHAPDNPAQSHTGQEAPRAQAAGPAMRSSCISSPANSSLMHPQCGTGSYKWRRYVTTAALSHVLSRLDASAGTKHCARCAACTQQHSSSRAQQAASHNNHMATAGHWQRQQAVQGKQVVWMPCRLHHASTALGPTARCWYSHAAQTPQQAVSHPKLNKVCSCVQAARSSLALLCSRDPQQQVALSPRSTVCRPRSQPRHERHAPAGRRPLGRPPPGR